MPRSIFRNERGLSGEMLESRLACTGDFQNPFSSRDVNDDGFIAPLDALVIIQELNRGGPRELTGTPTAAAFIDVDGDNRLTPIDALLVIVQLNTTSPALPITINYAPRSDPNGNGVILAETAILEGQTTPFARARLVAPGHATQTAVADAAGRFTFQVTANAGNQTLAVSVVDDLQRITTVASALRRGDVILDWNATLLNVIRDWTTLSNDPYPNRIVTSQPPLVARNLAMVHAAMFDAINGIEQTYEPYLVREAAPAGASPIAAAATAAHRVAYTLYAKDYERAQFDAALAESLAIVPDGPAKDAGIAWGRRVGDAMIAARASDGSKAAVAYVPGAEAGDWQRTFPDYYPPLLPQWPSVTPFAMSCGAQFRPLPPPTLDSAEYAAAVDELVAYGAYESQSRTTEQTDIALFWADGGGTFTPSGHWNQIAADVATARGQSLLENARTFALLNIALADAGIAAWDAKYTYNLWRPIDAIRQADTDDNPVTTAVSNWIPLIRTPPFPTYVSGHSTFSGAAATILTTIFGENVHFDSQADGHQGFTQRPLATSDVTTRSFASFQQAAEEAGQSRIYGGIHFQFDNQAGLESGRAIGSLVAGQFLQLIDADPEE